MTSHTDNPPTNRAPIRAVVFDFDGVVADSEPLHERALLETVRSRGLAFTHDQYQAEIIGYDDRDAFPAIHRLNDAPYDPADTDDLIAAKVELVHRLIREGAVQPFPGTLELARRVRDAGTPIAICSGALRAEIELMLEAFDAADLFPIIVAADDVPKAKPDPAGYRLAAERIGIEPAACACIEDTPTGIEAACAAGYGRVLAVEHSLPAPELGQATAIFATTAEITPADLVG